VKGGPLEGGGGGPGQADNKEDWSIRGRRTLPRGKKNSKTASPDVKYRKTAHRRRRGRRKTSWGGLGWRRGKGIAKSRKCTAVLLSFKGGEMPAEKCALAEKRITHLRGEEEGGVGAR